MKFTVESVWGSYMLSLQRSETSITQPQPVPSPLGLSSKKHQEQYDLAYYTLLPLAKSEFKRINDFYQSGSTQRWLKNKPSR